MHAYIFPDFFFEPQKRVTAVIRMLAVTPPNGHGPKWVTAVIRIVAVTAPGGTATVTATFR